MSASEPRATSSDAPADVGLPRKPVVGPETFAAVDLRVGVVVDVQAFPEARQPAWKIEVDLGPALGRRWTSAQVTNYAQDELRGRQVVCAVNLGEKRIASFTSSFLVLGAYQADGTVRLLCVDGELPPGSVVG